MSAGYSGKRLVEKLGVKPDSTVVLLETDLTEDVIRDLALAAGLVDTKVCAIDETWSGLRLTLRRS